MGEGGDSQGAQEALVFAGIVPLACIPLGHRLRAAAMDRILQAGEDSKFCCIPEAPKGVAQCSALLGIQNDWSAQYSPAGRLAGRRPWRPRMPPRLASRSAPLGVHSHPAPLPPLACGLRTTRGHEERPSRGNWSDEREQTPCSVGVSTSVTMLGLQQRARCIMPTGGPQRSAAPATLLGTPHCRARLPSLTHALQVLWR